MSIQTQFLEFLKDIEPSPTTKQISSNAHTSLRDYLKKHEDFSKYHMNTFLSGSYKRDTAIRPRRINGELEKHDIDIIVQTNHTLADAPIEVLKLLRNALSDEYVIKQPANTRSVGVITTQVDMDVIPIIAPYGEGNTLYIPDRKLESWIEANPEKHTSWSTEQNRISNGNFKPIVKLMKWWRRENPTISRRPKGFVIECIVAECMNPYFENYDDLLLSVFEGIVNYYKIYVDLKQVPPIPDPGVIGKYVTSGITFDAFEGFYNKAKNHLDLIEEAQKLQQTDQDEALKLWRIIFGNRFPEGEKRLEDSLLKAAAVAPHLEFPDRPVVPRGKTGFASL